MRTLAHVILLILTIALAACGEPQPVAEVCDEERLMAKIAKFGSSYSGLTQRVVASGNTDATAKFESYASRITEKTRPLKAPGTKPAGDPDYTTRLCKIYDELQAIVDEAAASGLAPEGAPAKDGKSG